MINDRGRIKWAPFMIPEHMKRIAQMYEAEDDVKQPELDEQLLEQLQETIAQAMESHFEVAITYHQNKRQKTVSGKIAKADPLTRLILLTSQDSAFKIPLQHIVNIVLK